jgi:hypothetical protein
MLSTRPTPSGSTERADRSRRERERARFAPSRVGSNDPARRRGRVSRDQAERQRVWLTCRRGRSIKRSWRRSATRAPRDRSRRPDRRMWLACGEVLRAFRLVDVRGYFELPSPWPARAPDRPALARRAGGCRRARMSHSETRHRGLPDRGLPALPLRWLHRDRGLQRQPPRRALVREASALTRPTAGARRDRSSRAIAAASSRSRRCFPRAGGSPRRSHRSRRVRWSR